MFVLSFLYLFQCLLPAVGFVAEWALKLLSHAAAAAAAATSGEASWPDAAAPIDVALAHELLQVLLQAGLVGEFSAAIRASQGSICAVVRSLEVVVEKALLREVLVAVVAHKRALPSVDSIMHVEMRFARVSLLADGAGEGFLSLTKI
jgi:hypothetical protein